MKFLLLLPVLATLTLSASAQKPPPAEVLRGEIAELETVVKTLREENRALARRNEQLMEELLVLGREVRALRERGGSDGSPVPAVDAPTVPSEEPPSAPAILYVNPTWHYLIVGAGTEAGLKVGAPGRILRDGAVIGRLKVTDVKLSQSVADLDLASLGDGGTYPRKGDRVAFP